MIFLVVFMHAILSSIFPVGRAVVLFSEPLFFNSVRMFLAGLLVLGYHYFRFRKFSPKLLTLIVPMALFTITGVYWTHVSEFWGLQTVPSAKASFIYSLSPFATALMSYIWFGEKMTAKKIIGMIIGVAGFTIMLIYDSPGEISQATTSFISWNEAMLISAAVASAYSWIIMRDIMKKKLCDPSEILGICLVAGGIIAFVHSLFVESWLPVPTTNYISFILYVVYAAVVSSALGHLLYTFLLQYYTATFLSFAVFLEPLFAALLAWFMLGETVTIHFFIAALLVFVGLYIFYIEELRQGYILKS